MFELYKSFMKLIKTLGDLILLSAARNWISLVLQKYLKLIYPQLIMQFDFIYQNSHCDSQFILVQIQKISEFFSQFSILCN